MLKKILSLTGLFLLGLIGVAYAEPVTATILGLQALPALTAAAGTAGVGAGLFSMFGKKKKSQDQADPLASLRAQLQGLAGQVPAQVAKQKELTAARIAEARRTGTQGIAENIRAERGFGNTSLQDRLNTELYDKLFKSQQEADLASDIWGTKTQADILSGTASMYPGAPPEEEPSWMTNLLGAGAGMAVQNWMQENQWKNLAKYFGGGTGGTTPTIDTGGYPDFSGLMQPATSSKYLTFGRK